MYVLCDINNYPPPPSPLVTSLLKNNKEIRSTFGKDPFFKWLCGGHRLGNSVLPTKTQQNFSRLNEVSQNTEIPVLSVNKQNCC